MTDVNRMTAVNFYVESKRQFGLFMRRMRVHNELSQIVVAKTLGFDTLQFISNIERGLVLLPAKHLHKTAELYGVKVELLASKLARIEEYRLLAGGVKR